MILYPRETVLVRGIGTTYAGAGVVMGTMTLTSLRFVFEAGGPAPYTLLNIGIEKIWNVHAGVERGGLLSPSKEFLTLESSQGRMVFETSNALGWAGALVQAKQAQPAPPPPPPRHIPPPPPGHGSGSGIAPGVPVVINVAAPAAPKILMKCRYCDALFDSAGGRCTQCGASP